MVSWAIWRREVFVANRCQAVEDVNLRPPSGDGGYPVCQAARGRKTLRGKDETKNGRAGNIVLFTEE